MTFIRPSLFRCGGFLGIGSLYLILIMTLGHVLIFPEPAPTAKVDGSNFHMVRISPPQKPAVRPQPPLPTPNLPLQPRGGSADAHLAAVNIIPAKVSFSQFPLPSLDHVLATLPQTNPGHGKGADWSLGEGAGFGDGNGSVPGSSGLSPERRLSRAGTKKPGSIFKYILAHDLGAVKAWLDEGNDPNISMPMQEHTLNAHIVCPLSSAVRNDDRDIVEMLLTHGANPNPPDPLDKHWAGLLYFAVQYHCSPELLKLLLEQGLMMKWRPAPPIRQLWKSSPTPFWRRSIRRSTMETKRPTTNGS